MTDKRRLTGKLLAFLTFAFLAFSGVFCDSASAASDDRTYRHGFSFFHELKYPADFLHFDYANPDAPKGGALVLPALMDFNTLSPIAEFLIPAMGLGWTYDSLFVRSFDEMSGFYGLLVEGLTIADDKRSVTLRLHHQGIRQYGRWGGTVQRGSCRF